MNVKDSQLFLAIDGGGTKCVARLFTCDLEELGHGMAGSANAYQSLQVAQESILNAAYSALDSANIARTQISELIVGAGLAGVNVSSVMQAMQSWQHPFKQFHITTDVHIACVGAHQKNTGAVVIVGTGTCGYVRHENIHNQEKTVEEFFIGGQGFPIGDQAGGAWMGFEAVRGILLAHDKIISSTSLTQKILDAWKILPNQLLDKVSSATPADFALLAPLVFESAELNDALAISILNEAGSYLDKMLQQIAQQKPSRIALVGGLSQKIIPWISEQSRSLISQPLGSPELGAMIWLKSIYCE